MTRYTFVLLVCRTVGVLAIFPLARFVCQLLPTWMLARAMSVGFSFTFPAGLALVAGLGIPVAAGVCGLKASNIASRLGIEAGEDGSKAHIRAATSISLIALLALPSCGELALAGFMRIWMSSGSALGEGSFGDMVITRLGVNFREIWHLLFEVAALVVAAVVVAKFALDAPGAKGDFNS